MTGGKEQIIRMGFSEMMLFKMNGVQYVVCNFFQGKESLKDRFGWLIKNSFDNAIVPKSTNDTLSVSDIAIQKE